MAKAVVLFALALVALSGCTATVRPYNSRGETTSEVVHEKNYSVGAVRTAWVGEAMIRSRIYTKTTLPVTEMRPSHNSVFRFGIGRVEARADKAYAIVGVTGSRDDEKKVVAIGPGARILVEDDGTISKQVLASNNQRVLPSLSVDPPETRMFPVVNERVGSKGGAGESNFELRYGGVTGDSIRVLYREYTSDDLARGDFTQDLFYSKDSDVIRFRQLRIRLQAATNESIVFVVESD